MFAQRVPAGVLQLNYTPRLALDSGSSKVTVLLSLSLSVSLSSLDLIIRGHKTDFMHDRSLGAAATPRHECEVARSSERD